MLTMARNGAGIAHGSRSVIVIGVGWGRVAGQTRKEILAKRTEIIGAGVKGLCIVHG
jgi:hypothetical protein